MKQSIMKYIILLSALTCFSWSCSSDVLESNGSECDDEVSYDNGIKDIIDETCAYSGCHNGGGSAPGDYRTFDGLQRFINDGSFVERVIDVRDNPTRGMPPDRIIYPETLQDDLTESQLELVTCWIQNNFPE